MSATFLKTRTSARNEILNSIVILNISLDLRILDINDKFAANKSNNQSRNMFIERPQSRRES